MASIQALVERFAQVGVVAIYGGGKRKKGDGFWLYMSTPECAVGYWQAIKAGICNRVITEIPEVPGECALNDGKNSGNPHFWMRSDALVFLREHKRALAA